MLRPRSLMFIVAIVPSALVLQAPQFRTSVDVVPIYVLVMGPDGRVVTNLTRDDFVLRDNGRLQDIVNFSSAEQPITAALLLDVSGSMANTFARVRSAAIHFVQALHSDDRLRIGSFSDEVAISPHLTSDKSILTRVLTEELWLGDGTALWRAANSAMTSLATEGGRRVVVIISDGDDSETDSSIRKRAMESVRQRAVAEAFLFCAIEIQGKGISSDLSRLTELTGGGHVSLPADGNLDLAFEALLSNLRHQYLLGFSAVAPLGATHKISVSVKQPGYRVQAPLEVFVR